MNSQDAQDITILFHNEFEYNEYVVNVSIFSRHFMNFCRHLCHSRKYKMYQGAF